MSGLKRSVRKEEKERDGNPKAQRGPTFPICISIQGRKPQSRALIIGTGKPGRMLAGEGPQLHTVRKQHPEMHFRCYIIKELHH